MNALKNMFILAFSIFLLLSSCIYVVPLVKASVSTVTSVKTKIGLEVGYNGLFRCLYLSANLTTVDGYPIANETIEFHFQFDKGRRCEGWLRLISVKTGSDGSVQRGVGFALDDGNYRIRARFEGNENYSKSENIKSIQIAMIPIENFSPQQNTSSQPSNDSESIQPSTDNESPVSTSPISTIGVGALTIFPFTILFFAIIKSDSKPGKALRHFVRYLKKEKK
jgi:hypothetical protein